MRYVKCSACGKEQIPQNDSLSIDGAVYCHNCIAEVKGEHLKGRKVIKDFDPTVCASCNKDFDDRPLPKLGSYPVCTDCQKGIEKKIAPTWVKAFFAFILIIVLFSFGWNWRFFQAHNEIQSSMMAYENGDVSQAADLMEQARNHAPESGDLKPLAAYYRGIALLSEDKSEEALKKFADCKDFLPEDYGVEILLLQADMGAVFDSKDYIRFLAGAKELLELDTTNLMSVGAVASAYACLYATTQNDSIKNLSQLYLQRAAVGKDDSIVAEFVNRIEHRLATREIIEREEFVKKYPNGWSN